MFFGNKNLPVCLQNVPSFSGGSVYDEDKQAEVWRRKR
jgi:hypothetical protein